MKNSYYPPFKNCFIFYHIYHNLSILAFIIKIQNVWINCAIIHEILCLHIYTNTIILYSLKNNYFKLFYYLLKFDVFSIFIVVLAQYKHISLLSIIRFPPYFSIVLRDGILSFLADIQKSSIPFSLSISPIKHKDR